MESLRVEIEALRIAAPLLSDDGDDNSAAPSLYPLGRADAAVPGSAGGELRPATGTRP